MNNKLFVFLVSDDEAFIARHKDFLSREVDLNVHRSAEDYLYGFDDGHS
ncbi:MAG TPA: hypothetical protein PLI90_12375 [Rhodocyclaceae bacterium]|nr:hypothetical protein [Rhodocyclaceae bacterium]